MIDIIGQGCLETQRGKLSIFNIQENEKKSF